LVTGKFRQKTNRRPAPVITTVHGEPAERRRRWPDGVSPEFAELMERVCTEAELDVLGWKARGYGTRKIAERLGVSRPAVQDRLRNAERKLLAAREGR
jgi:DNA-binding CsgD family transcriptional regulator